jgi:hypothetical protein
VDPLFRSLCETALNAGSYEAKEIFVSMGLAQQYQSSSSLDDNSNSTNNNTDSSNGYPTVLSKENAFVQLNGQSMIEVDNTGIFISIPTLPAASANKSTKPSNDSGTGGGPRLNTTRRGLRIPASANMKVMSVQSSSIVLSIHIKKKNLENTIPPPPSPGVEGSPATPSKQMNRSRSKSGGNGTGNGEEEQMRQFLSSSILAIPWTYEGHSLSPAAYIAENESKLSPEERERLLKEAEEDSVIFANTVVVMAEFISTVPEGTEEILICFSGSDKLIRDILAFTMRTFTCFPEKMSRYDRLLHGFPWFQEDIDEANENNNGEGYEAAESELKKRLKVVEEDNSFLKKERNELTKQLLSTKEEIALLKASRQQQHQLQSGGGSLDSSDHHPFSPTSNVGDSEYLPSITSPIVNSSEEFKELSVKVIEMENKLTISLRKEVEATKARTEAEGKNSKLTADMEKLRKLNEDLKVNVTTLQMLCDRQSHTLHTKDDELVEHLRTVKALEEQLQEIEMYKQAIEESNSMIDDLK